MRLAVELPLDRIGEICRKYGVVELAVFGSVVRDDFGPDSDVDFLYVLPADSRIGMEFFSFREELHDVMGGDVDVVPKNHLHWVIRHRDIVSW